MKKTIVILVSSALLVATAQAQVDPSTANSEKSPPTAVSAQTSGQSMPKQQSTPDPQAQIPLNPITTTLRDGTKIEIDSDASVYILNSDGSKTAAPDGVHTLRDGTSFTVRNGKRSNE